MKDEFSGQPIAVFDSGLGGLTVLAEIHRQLPSEDLIFLADRARVPYASLSPGLITKYALECFAYLKSFHPKAVVVACNTVSCVCLEEIRAQFDCPVIDVISPTADEAAKRTRNSRIGVIATTATIKRRAYEIALGERVPALEIASQGCPLLVPLVEEGWTEGEIPEKIVQHYVEPVAAAGVDTAVLGCTHYEYFRDLLQTNLGSHVTLVNTPQVTARALVQAIEQGAVERAEQGRGLVRILSTDVTDALYTVAGSLFDLEQAGNTIRISPTTLETRIEST